MSFVLGAFLLTVAAAACAAYGPDKALPTATVVVTHNLCSEHFCGRIRPATDLTWKHRTASGYSYARIGLAVRSVSRHKPNACLVPRIDRKSWRLSARADVRACAWRRNHRVHCRSWPRRKIYACRFDCGSNGDLSVDGSRQRVFRRTCRSSASMDQCGRDR